jgi:tetratricopeptide (TPR) repeat protein
MSLPEPPAARTQSEAFPPLPLAATRASDDLSDKALLASVVVVDLVAAGVIYAFGDRHPWLFAVVVTIASAGGVFSAFKGEWKSTASRVTVFLLAVSVPFVLVLPGAQHHGLGRTFDQVMGKGKKSLEMRPILFKDGRNGFVGREQSRAFVTWYTLVGSKDEIEQVHLTRFLPHLSSTFTDQSLSVDDRKLQALGANLPFVALEARHALPDSDSQEWIREGGKLLLQACQAGSATLEQSNEKIRAECHVTGDDGTVSLHIEAHNSRPLDDTEATLQNDSSSGAANAELPNTAPQAAPAVQEQPSAGAVAAPEVVEILPPPAARPVASPPAAPSVVPVHLGDDEAPNEIGKAASAEELNRQGGVLLAQGRQEESIPFFDRAFALDPKLTGALLNKGYALQRIGRLVEAQGAGDKVLELSGVARIRASAQVLLGKISEGNGQVGQARARYQQALREKSDYPQALEALRALPTVDEARENNQPPSPTPAQKRTSGPDHKPNPFVDPSHEEREIKPKRWADPFAPE